MYRKPLLRLTVLTLATLFVLPFTMGQVGCFGPPLPVAGDVPPSLKPTAVAGSDQIIGDTNYDGSETVMLDGSRSFDPDGSIVGYRWTTDGHLLGTGPTLTTSLPSGFNEVLLTVVDDSGQVGADEVRVTVGPVAETAILAPEVRPIDPQSQWVMDVTENSMTYQSVADDPEPFVPGDIVIGTGPNGDPFFIRVAEVTEQSSSPAIGTTGNIVTLKGQRAALEEVFQELDIDLRDYPLSFMTNAEQAASTNQITLLDDDELRVSANFDFGFNPKPNINFALKIGSFKVKKFRLIINGGVEADLGIDVLVKKPFTRSAEKKIKTFPIIPVCIPDTLICICPSLELSVGFEGTSDAAGEIAYSEFRSASARIGLDCPGGRGTCDGIFEFDYFSSTNVDYDVPGVVDLKVYGKAAIITDILCQPLKAGELELAIIPYVELDSELSSVEGFAVTAPPGGGTGGFPVDECALLPPVGSNKVGYVLQAGVDGLVGGKVNPLGLTLFEDEITFGLLKKVIDSGCHIYNPGTVSGKLGRLLDDIFRVNIQNSRSNGSDAKTAPILSALDATFQGKNNEAVQAVNNFLGITEQQMNEGAISPEEAQQLNELASDILTGLSG